MKVIPTKYLLEEGANVPEDTVVKECPSCGRKFAVPKTELEENVSDLQCEECEAKKSSADAIIDMKTSNSDINAALGK